MKTFNFKFKSYVYCLLALALVVSITSFVLNVYNVVSYFSLGGIKVVSYLIISAVTLFIAVYVISLLCYSKYRINGNDLVCNLGFYKTTLSILDVTEVINFTTSEKLVIYFGKRGYSVIVIAKENYDEFISLILKVNPQIRFSVNSKGKI